MAAALQRGAAAFEPWLSHAGRVRGEGRDARRNERPSDGAERCGTWGLRAPPRRTTASQGANQGSNRGGRLKLNVVRRIWAGQVICCSRSLAWLAKAREKRKNSRRFGVHSENLGYVYYLH